MSRTRDGESSGDRCRALFVFQNAALPSSRIRVLEMIPHLRAAGIDADSAPYPTDARQRGMLRARMADFDIIVLQKKAPSFPASLTWQRCPRPLVFDYDDAIMFRDRPRRGSHHSWVRNHRFRRITRACSGLIAGNDYLASFAPLGTRVLVAPSPVPHDVPLRDHASQEDVLRIGWVGLGRNLRTLEPIRPVLAELARTHRFELVIVSDQEYALEGCRVSNVSWSRETQHEWIARFDVGIMVLEPDSPWNRGKCSYKALQYMAAAVPVVASDVGMNRDLFKNSCGLLASGEGAWLESLVRLLKSRDLRKRLGHEGRTRIEQDFTYRVQAERIARFLEALRR